MKLYKSFHALTRGNLIVLGIELGALYWIFESGIYAFAFQRGNFFQQIFMPEAHEIWMRGFVILVLFIFGAITQTVLAKHKRAEQALREQRSREQEYLDIAGVMLVVLDECGDITLINKKGCEVLGYTDTELLGKSWFETCLPKGIREEVSSVYRKLMEGELGLVKYYENPVLTANGEERTIAWHNTVLKDDFGKIIGTLSSGENITERKQAEEALRESEDKFRTLSEESFDGIIVHDNGRIIEANRIFAKTWGYEPSEVIGMQTEDFIAPESIETVKQAIFSGSEKPYEALARKKDGLLFSIEIIGKTIQYKGKNVRISTARDITERKRAEEALKESETKYRSLIEHSNDAIFLRVGDKFELVNPRFLELFEVTLDDLHAPDFTYVKLVAPRSRSLIEERNRRWELGEEVPSRYEFTGVRTDGKEIDLEASVARVPYRGGMATQGILRDITERKKMEAQLRQTQKMEAMGTLAGGIAHDFNNILMAMLGYSDMARQDIPKDSPARVSLKAVFEAGARAKDLVNQILTFSRQTEHERQPVKIHPIVKEALKLLRASLPTTIEIRKNIDTNCGIILADPTQIHQVMMNLCTNAFHAMREKGGVLDVSLKNVEVDASYMEAYPQLSPGKYIRLVVSDTGCGMDKATMARIFDPFFTSKAVGEGTGMGLSTVHGIVKSHEGAITVYSEPGKGSSFNVYFPAMKVETVAEIPPDEPVTRGEESILFVDDEVQLAELGQRMLEFMGYHVTIRTSSVEALEAFRATPDKFDLVISDLTMPNMTGMELAEEIMRIRPDVPVILATGFSETVTPEKARKVGVSLYLNKPIILSELGKAVRQVLDVTAQEK